MSLDKLPFIIGKFLLCFLLIAFGFFSISSSLFCDVYVSMNNLYQSLFHNIPSYSDSGSFCCYTNSCISLNIFNLQLARAETCLDKFWLLDGWNATVLCLSKRKSIIELLLVEYHIFYLIRKHVIHTHWDIPRSPTLFRYSFYALTQPFIP